MRKLNMGTADRRATTAGVARRPTRPPQRLATPTPTIFSDLVDILHNGQRQGVLLFNNGISTTSRTPPSFNSIPLGGVAKQPSVTRKSSQGPALSFEPTFVPSATQRTFFSSSPIPPSTSSQFPFDRRVHQQQRFRPVNAPPPQQTPFRATPTFSTPSNPSFINTTPFNPGPSSFPIQPQTNIGSQFSNSNNIINNQNIDNALVEALRSASSSNTVAPRPEKLIIHVVEQQKLGKLKTSDGPVEQKSQQLVVKKPRKNNRRKNKNSKQVLRSLGFPFLLVHFLRFLLVFCLVNFFETIKKQQLHVETKINS